ncbi:MAG: Gfo/Idh/MocA family protein [Planctomycetota bacterium]
MSLRVAVLGASGFGRHHARWFHTLGCDVIAFLGSSPASIETTDAALRDAFGFHGRGYTSLPELLAAERPDAVSVCTPPALHGPHAREAIEAGCAVLCEKPFVMPPGATSSEVIAEARRLVEAAAERGVALAVNTQYAAAAEPYRDLAGPLPASPSRFFAEMTSRLRPTGPRGREIWLDLMPHTVSMLLALCPDAALRMDGIRGTIEEEGCEVRFQVATGGGACQVEMRVAKLAEPPFTRRFGLDDRVAEVGTAPDEQGVYRGYVRLGEREQRCDDFMRTSIERFCSAVRGEGAVLVDGQTALRNTEMMLATLDAVEGA